MRTLVSIFIAVIAATGVFAQAQPVTQKIGYADWDKIFSQMPEYKQIDADLKAHSNQLKATMDAKQKELEQKYQAYQNMPATTPDAIRADKEAELNRLQESLQKFSQDAQTSLQNKQNQLMDPVFTKVAKAIEDVAKENGYTFIIQAQLLQGGDILLYSDEKYDVSTLVLKKMGVTVAATPAKP